MRFAFALSAQMVVIDALTRDDAAGAAIVVEGQTNNKLETVLVGAEKPRASETQT